MPLISVWDLDEATEHRAGGFVQSMNVNIETFRESCGENFSVVGNRSLGDIKRALFSADPTLAGLAEGITLAGSRIDFPAPSQTIVKTTTDIIIQYTEARGDPAAKP